MIKFAIASIHLFSSAHPDQGLRGAGAYPICYMARGRVQRGQDAGLFQG